MKMVESYRITTRTEGSCFATVGVVVADGEVIHTTDSYPFGFTAPAELAARKWARSNLVVGGATLHAARAVREKFLAGD